MRDVPQDQEVWEMTIVYNDGTRSKPKKVKGLTAAFDYEEKKSRDRNVARVEGKRVQ